MMMYKKTRSLSIQDNSSVAIEVLEKILKIQIQYVQYFTKLTYEGHISSSKINFNAGYTFKTI